MYALPTFFHEKNGSFGDCSTSFCWGAYTCTNVSDSGASLTLKKYLQVSRCASWPRYVSSDSPHALYTASFGRCASIAGSQQALPCSLQVGFAGSAGAPPAPPGAGGVAGFCAYAAVRPVATAAARATEPIRIFRCVMGNASFIYMRGAP